MLLKYVPTHLPALFVLAIQPAAPAYSSGDQVGRFALRYWQPTPDKSRSGAVSGAARRILDQSRAFLREQSASSRNTKGRRSRF
jgi:hypothetical protein